jgi:chromosome segregation ATPase
MSDEIGAHEHERDTCRCAAREAALMDRELAVASADRDTALLRTHLAELTQQLQQSTAQDAAAARCDRQRLELEAASLDAAVSALQHQRSEATLSLQAEREALAAARTARDEERARFLAEIQSERKRVSEERHASWAEVQKARDEAQAVRGKLADLEARASLALTELAKASQHKTMAEADTLAMRADTARCYINLPL